MVSAFRFGLVLLTALVVQRAVFAQIAPFGVHPDALLALAVVAGLTLGPDRGAICGFAAGIGLDLLGATPFGLAGLAYCVVGWTTGRYQASVVRASRRRLMVTTFVASAVGYAFYALLGWVLGERGMISADLWRYVLVVAVVNALVAPLVARALRWAFDERIGRSVTRAPSGRWT